MPAHAIPRADRCCPESDEYPTLVCIVSSPDGVAEMGKDHPGLTIHTAALNRALNSKKYILPGLGDFGDRLYGQ